MKRPAAWVVLATALLANGILSASPADAQGRDDGAFGAVADVSPQRLSGHAFVSAGSSGGSGGGGRNLLRECFEAHARDENYNHYERRIQAGDDEAAALASLPWPSITPPLATSPPGHCAGEAIVLIGSGRTCDAGQVPAERIIYSYVAPSPPNSPGRFDLPSLHEARIRSGDVGPSIASPLVCVRVWDPDAISTSDFVEAVPEAQIHKSPHVTGLVNLETWSWYDFSDPSSYSVTGTAQVDLHGLAIVLESEIWVDKVEWDFDGDGNVDAVADPPDTELAAATHAAYIAAGGDDSESGGLGNFVFKKMGTYNLTTTVTWRGVYRVSAIADPGGETITFHGSRNVLNPVEVTNSESYDVRSVRTELRHRKPQ